jgi:outer membrane biosynthesis protein TonB
MIDLFGMGKAPQDGPNAPDAAEPRKPQAGSHGLWLFLLVLDSIFVIVFGGAGAAKVYQYWKAPAAVVAPAVRRRPVPKPAETAKAPEPAPAPKPAPAPEPPKPASKPEPRISRRAESPRPPKPSLINEPPKPRSTPALATTAAPASPAPAAAASGAATKALPVVFKLHAANAGAVQLVGAFIVHGGRKEMTRSSDGTWSVKLYLNPGQYRYFFSVDKKKTLDPENPNSDRGASLLTVP